MAKKVTSKIENEIQSNRKWYIIAKGYAARNNLSTQQIADIIADETTKAINRDIDPEAIINFVVDEEREVVSIINTNATVVEDEFEFNGDQDVQKISFVPISKAKKVKKSVEIDDAIDWEIDFEIFNEKTKTAIKNGFIQQLKANEKAAIYNKYSKLIGEKLKAKILSKNKDGSYNLGLEDGVTAFLPYANINQKLNLNPGLFIDVYVDNVSEENKLSQVQVSTDSPQAIYDLLNKEVPEIAQGLIDVVSIQRVPGMRSKIAVKKSNPADSLDPISSIIGYNGSRINEISNALGGEKVDVILYSDVKEEFVKNALLPAKIIDVVKNNGADNYYFAIVASDSDMYVAMGRGVVNVNLAKKLTGTRIELLKVSEAIAKGIEFKKQQSFEKPLIGKFVNRSPKKSKSTNYFDGIDIDINDFANDVNSFIETQKTIEETKAIVKEAKKAAVKQQKEKNEKAKSENPRNEQTDFDSMFDEVVSNFDHSNDTYDFLDAIDENTIFDDNEESEFKDEISELEENQDNKKPEETLKSKYKKAKVDLKDFKEDNDLTNYGLDSNLDLSDFDDEWEK
ncbi:transcription termination/antitermination protein NusA [Mycoplasma crocodyli]|uniref:Transcription termination/antitermination protein NusA n=1 Tax=Mycoplasma crocodyli (strain ATCC 51981 / MP145) TaxID=512564 RepID=D5E4K5_MYCCM|nr:transcription termination/antitermination protein NusA [Mycoplasma crocodyli]ADE19746.1 transcription termination factor NusA [Mycoplasma crocodyli MP145]